MRFFFSLSDGNIERNDYPSTRIVYSVIDKNAFIQIDWFACGYNGTLATLDINLNEDNTGKQWIFNNDIIKKFNDLCHNNESLQKRLDESIKLIPKENSFVTSYVFDISSSFERFLF